MIYSKVTYGYVVQSYDSETGDCVQQNFISDERVERQDDNGQVIPEEDTQELLALEKECALDMVQP